MINLGVYRHYGGALYLVTAIARHTETLNPMIVYHGLTGDYRTWTQPLDKFESKVSVDGKLVTRYTFMRNNPRETPPIFK